MDIPQNSDTLVTINDPTSTHLYHLKLIVCIRVHSWYCIFYGFGQKCTDTWSFPGGTVVKNLSANAEEAGDLGSIPESGKSPQAGNSNALQYSCLENSMDRGAWWATVHGVAKSQTQLGTHTHLQ